MNVYILLRDYGENEYPANRVEGVYSSMTLAAQAGNKLHDDARLERIQRLLTSTYVGGRPSWVDSELEKAQQASDVLTWSGDGDKWTVKSEWLGWDELTIECHEVHEASTE